MASAWASRIRWIVHRYSGGVQTEFGRKVGITQQAASNLYRGATVPSAETLAAICEAWPQVNARWLLTGKGPREKPARNEVKMVEDATAEIREALDAVLRRYGIE